MTTPVTPRPPPLWPSPPPALPHAPGAWRFTYPAPKPHSPAFVAPGPDGDAARPAASSGARPTPWPPWPTPTAASRAFATRPSSPSYPMRSSASPNWPPCGPATCLSTTTAAPQSPYAAPRPTRPARPPNSTSAPDRRRQAPQLDAGRQHLLRAPLPPRSPRRPPWPRTSASLQHCSPHRQTCRRGSNPRLPARSLPPRRLRPVPCPRRRHTSRDSAGWPVGLQPHARPLFPQGSGLQARHCPTPLSGQLPTPESESRYEGTIACPASGGPGSLTLSTPVPSPVPWPPARRAQMRVRYGRVPQPESSTTGHCDRNRHQRGLEARRALAGACVLSEDDS